MAWIMYSSPLPRLMSPNVQITGRPASPTAAFGRTFVALKRHGGHAVRNHAHVRPRHAVDVGQQPGGNLRHHDDALAVGRQVLDQAARQRVRLGQQRVERGDDRLAAAATKSSTRAPHSPGYRPNSCCKLTTSQGPSLATSAARR